MTKEQLQRECQFGAAMAIADRLLTSEIISKTDYMKIREILLKKHVPLIAGSAEYPKIFT